MPNKLQGVVATAVSAVQSLIDVYPQRFHSIDQVKRFIDHICESKGYSYDIQPGTPDIKKQHIKDTVLGLVARQAYKDGEFYLDQPLGDKEALHAAVEADAKRVLLLITEWPPSFPSMKKAKAHVQSICVKNGFRYSEFPGTSAVAFKAFVETHAARDAFQASSFTLENQIRSEKNSPHSPVKNKENSPSPPAATINNLDDVPIKATGPPSSIFNSKHFADLQELQEIFEKDLRDRVHTPGGSTLLNKESLGDLEMEPLTPDMGSGQEVDVEDEAFNVITSHFLARSLLTFNVGAHC
ncbi:hypothetical protein BDV95DRAFT_595140 [Massariosphaeria phaeospora]|uniref:Uncharacterized protein n=1 Tax=Massariosphaeria phaeospora TaxID=100035 RepID=A0A7C8M813_9PLEO|nr:hypothetical protein BDV95DRAFT_595140 [Massariosphaeria phaeospora]